MENAKTRMTAAFEFMSKLGIRHYTFHDAYVDYALSFFYLLAYELFWFLTDSLIRHQLCYVFVLIC